MHHVGTKHAIKVVLVHTHLRVQQVWIVPSEATLYLRMLQLLVGHHHVLGVGIVVLSFGIGRRGPQEIVVPCLRAYSHVHGGGGRLLPIGLCAWLTSDSLLDVLLSPLVLDILRKGGELSLLLLAWSIPNIWHAFSI